MELKVDILDSILLKKKIGSESGKPILFQDTMENVLLCINFKEKAKNCECENWLSTFTSHAFLKA